ncbi:hypothetical protein KEM55_004200 [Ascosphaera atra]|nr:hypothetical protein KEM55_004200 [Ascosphaera atra]
MPRRKRLRRSRQEPAANAATPGNGPPPQPQRTTRHSARLSARAQVDDGANNHPENANGLTSQPSTDQSSSPNENESTEAPADSSDPTSSAPSEGPSPDKPADEDGETQSLRSGTHTPPNDAIVDDARSDNAVANASDESENDQLSQVNDVSNEDADKDSPQEGINTPPPEPTSRATSQAATRATSQLPDASSNLAVPGTESATQSRLVTPVPDTGGIVTPTSVPAQTSRRGNGTRGRQRGGRRGGPARGNGNGRGRYTRNGRGRGGRLQPIEADQPTTSSPFFRGLRERQKELERSFRRVGNAHRGALATLATRWEEILAKDPNAHMKLPGWKNVCDELDRRLNDRLEVVRAERNYRLQEANTLCAAEKNRLETKLGYQCAHVQREYLMAVMGDCIAQCEKIAKGDEDKSEDQSEAESENDSPEDTDPNKDNAAPASENEFRLPVKRTFVRGWNSTGCSEVENAALIDRALYQWGEMMEWVKHPEKVQESLESRKAEVVSREATVANAKTEGEVSQGKDKTLFNMLAQVCGDELQTVTTAEGNLSTLATVAAGEGKPDSGKTKASDETLIEEERIEEFTTINNRQAEREAADVEAFRRRAAEESAEREKADRERLRTLEPPPFPSHAANSSLPVERTVGASAIDGGI